MVEYVHDFLQANVFFLNYLVDYENEKGPQIFFALL